MMQLRISDTIATERNGVENLSVSSPDSFKVEYFMYAESMPYRYTTLKIARKIYTLAITPYSAGMKTLV
jgi:hypothetical protein